MSQRSRIRQRALRRALMHVAAHCDREQYFNQHRQRYEMILDRFVRYNRGRRVLDVGAAPGHLALTLAAAGYDTHGIVFDLNEDWENTPAQARRFAAQAQRSRLTLAQCDIQAAPLPYPAASFDFAVFTEVLEHLWTFPLQVVREIGRVLRPGGYLLVTTPNATSLKNRVGWLRGRTSYTSLETMCSLPIHMRHNREYTCAELGQLLARAGFEIVENGCHEWHTWTTPRHGQPGYEAGFRVNTPKQLAKLLLLPVTVAAPWSRGGLIAVGRKPEAHT